MLARGKRLDDDKEYGPPEESPPLATQISETLMTPAAPQRTTPTPGSSAAQTPTSGTVLQDPKPDTDIKVDDKAENEAPMDETAPVPGSQHINFGYLYGLNRDKAKLFSQQIVSGAQKKARDALSALSGAGAAHGAAVKAGSGTPYQGEYVPVVQQGQRASGSAGSGTLGTTQNALSGTPQRGVPGAITPSEAQARAQQVYTGPEELAGYDDLMAQSEAAQRRAVGLGSAAGLQGVLGEDLGALGGYAVNPAGNSAKSRWGAALLGAAGGGAFREASERYADLIERTKALGVDAHKTSAAAKAKTEADAKLYGSALDDYLRMQEAEDAKPGAPERLALPDYDAWLANTDPADPDDAIRRAITGDSLYWFSDAGYGAEGRAIYESLTDDEIRMLRKWVADAGGAPENDIAGNYNRAKAHKKVRDWLDVRREELKRWKGLRGRQR